jgi:hypothetical protein
VKCGTEEEKNAPKAGNRGKRDSQVRKKTNGWEMDDNYCNSNSLCYVTFFYIVDFDELLPTCLV